MTPSAEGGAREKAALGVGLVVALVGLANSMPAFGPLPRLGPFPAEPLRALIFALSVFSALCVASFHSLLSGKSRKFAPLGAVMDAVVLCVALFAFWRFYADVTAIDEGLFFFDPFHAWTALAGCACIVALCWRVWGAPLAVCGIVALLYFLTSEHWPGIFKTAPLDFAEDVAGNLWFNLNDGVLGIIFGVIVSTILPFILLGAMLEGSGGGGALVKISFHLMRRFRGGPAHAAILASGMFGAVSGSAVANVVGTGVLTIPMIRRRGFSPAFAGGVEAAASTGGQLMPPIMGAAALLMADLTAIPYLTVIIAALVPALAYYAGLFAAVAFESRRMGVEAKEDGDSQVTRGDWIKLALVAVPVATVVAALVYGASPSGAAILALMILAAMSFLNPEVRRAPFKIVLALAKGGANVARLLMAVGVVGIIVGVMQSTGLPTNFANLAGAASGALLTTLALAALSALVLGMGMPTLPAYLTIVIILGPSLFALGLEPLTAHMFVFYFGVASAITPPVAIAAYAAAGVSGAPPLRTALAAVRIGMMIFPVPFAFALNPVMLMVPESGAAFEWGAFLSVVFRLLLCIYMLASAASGMDRERMGWAQIGFRLAAAVFLLAPSAAVHWGAAALAAALIASHRIAPRESTKGLR